MQIYGENVTNGASAFHEIPREFWLSSLIGIASTDFQVVQRRLGQDLHGDRVHDGSCVDGYLVKSAIGLHVHKIHSEQSPVESEQSENRGMSLPRR